MGTFCTKNPKNNKRPPFYSDPKSIAGNISWTQHFPDFFIVTWFSMTEMVPKVILMPILSMDFIIIKYCKKRWHPVVKYLDMSLSCFWPSDPLRLNSILEKHLINIKNYQQYYKNCTQKFSRSEGTIISPLSWTLINVLIHTESLFHMHVNILSWAKGRFYWSAKMSNILTPFIKIFHYSYPG